MKHLLITSGILSSRNSSERTSDDVASQDVHKYGSHTTSKTPPGRETSNHVEVSNFQDRKSFFLICCRRCWTGTHLFNEVLQHRIRCALFSTGFWSRIAAILLLNLFASIKKQAVRAWMYTRPFRFFLIPCPSSWEAKAHANTCDVCVYSLCTSHYSLYSLMSGHLFLQIIRFASDVLLSVQGFLKHLVSARPCQTIFVKPSQMHPACIGVWTSGFARFG